MYEEKAQHRQSKTEIPNHSLLRRFPTGCHLGADASSCLAPQGCNLPTTSNSDVTNEQIINFRLFKTTTFKVTGKNKYQLHQDAD